VKINLRVLAPVSLVAATVLALTGCGSQSASGSGSTPASSPSAAAPSSSSAPGAAFVIGDGGVTVTGDLGVKPTVAIGADTKSTTQLTVKDLVVGTGPEAKAGDTVTAHYVGIGAISGKQFDSSWDRGQAAQFPLNQVIVGWQNGIPGMKVGGRRLLVIPGDQAYGANPPPGSNIQANEALVFVVDLVSIP
jgi:peptidylprolyl isomerase